MRLVRVATAMTLAAGVVGVFRQLGEARAVARGELSVPSAAVVLPARRGDDALSARLAGWVPPPPHSTLGRALATLWASPLSLIGGAVALLSAKHARWDTARHCVVARGVRGPSAIVLRLVGADANTIGQVVLCRSEEPSATLLDHEAVHVRQAERLGPLLFGVYVWLAAVYGYRDHPLERAARLGARRALTGPCC